MFKLKDIGISTRLRMGFGIFVIIILIMALIGLWGVYSSVIGRIVLPMVALVALVIALFMSTMLAKSITDPLARLNNLHHLLAKGDLTATVSVNRKDEFAEDMKAMMLLIEKWRAVIGQVKGAATNMSSAGMQLSASAEQLSQGSATQMERTSQVATASEEMAQTIIEIARNTAQIADSAANTVNIAEAGQDVVKGSVREVKEIAQTMNETATFVKTLGERSSQIGQIISVINDIADQTNLLALNAAIEAARAGEQGRGFAVVADEVRKLAERTANATSEIGGMIKAIQDGVNGAITAMEVAVKKVDTGVELTMRGGSSLDEIVKSVNGLQVMVQQIASATEQMSATSEEINRDIEQIATFSREASSGSENTAEAAGELARLAKTLEQTVSEFKLP